jgi:hypothetical protein
MRRRPVWHARKRGNMLRRQTETALTDRVPDREPFRQNAGTSLAAKFVFL